MAVHFYPVDIRGSLVRLMADKLRKNVLHHENISLEAAVSYKVSVDNILQESLEQAERLQIFKPAKKNFYRIYDGQRQSVCFFTGFCY